MVQVEAGHARECHDAKHQACAQAVPDHVPHRSGRHRHSLPAGPCGADRLRQQRARNQTDNPTRNRHHERFQHELPSQTALGHTCDHRHADLIAAAANRSTCNQCQQSDATDNRHGNQHDARCRSGGIKRLDRLLVSGKRRRGDLVRLRVQLGLLHQAHERVVGGRIRQREDDIQIRNGPSRGLRRVKPVLGEVDIRRVDHVLTIVLCVFRVGSVAFRHVAVVFVNAAHGERVCVGSLRRIADRHFVADLEIVLIGQRLRNEYAVALRLIAQMLAFDYLVVAVVVDFRGVQRVERLQSQVAAGLVFAGVVFRGDRLQRLAFAHRHRCCQRVIEGHVVALCGRCIRAVLFPRQILVGIAGIGTVALGLCLRVRTNHRRGFLRLVCFIIGGVVGSNHCQVHGSRERHQ